MKKRDEENTTTRTESKSFDRFVLKDGYVLCSKSPDPVFCSHDTRYSITGEKVYFVDGVPPLAVPEELPRLDPRPGRNHRQNPADLRVFLHSIHGSLQLEAACTTFATTAISECRRWGAVGGNGSGGSIYWIIDCATLIEGDFGSARITW